MTSPLYRFDGKLFHPGPQTVGPWSPDAQHGGPVAGLLARAVEAASPGSDMQVVRLTVELMRPVPVAPLEVTANVTRPGRRVQLTEASIRDAASGSEVAAARALSIRRAQMDVPVDRSGPPVPPPAVEDALPAPGAPRTAFIEAVDLRFVKGSWDETGPVTMWARLLVPVVEGEEPTPLQRAAAIADFGNGVSRLLDFESHVFINPDLTVALARVPEGEWIGYDVVSRLSTEGFGQAESQIFDSIGPCGRAVQSLIVSDRSVGA